MGSKRTRIYAQGRAVNAAAGRAADRSKLTVRIAREVNDETRGHRPICCGGRPIDSDGVGGVGIDGGIGWCDL